ncbi:hypothetical protein QBC40DRAFT_259238 [Triangularia verruculosa]|uniref:RING-type domain-containing protein n=1 Tax=Triangularia verruculosa TaxID=2587418 RepID=A0AAN7ARQ9_9PEZI|nr:hypothetical protein QBC40DRAFT_259238 [Triangularia verruculosa]
MRCHHHHYHFSKWPPPTPAANPSPSSPNSNPTSSPPSAPSSPPPIVLCPICTSPHEILTPLTPSRLRPTALPGIVLFCGHMVCKPCFTIHHNSIRTLESSPPESYRPASYIPAPPPAPPTVDCPVCEHPLSHADTSFCRHTLHTPAICPASGVPKTLPEGGQAPRFCSECRVLIGRLAGQDVVRLKGLGVTDADEMLREVTIKVPQSWDENFPMYAVDGVMVEDGKDPVEYIQGEVRRGIRTIEEETGSLWAQPEGEVSGKWWEERRGEYM